MDRFQALLNQISPLIDEPLYADRKRAVRITINETLHVHLEDDEPKDRILIATFISEIPPGRYRENLLKEGLKSNAQFPRVGTFAYSERNNQLCLFEYHSYVNLTGEKVADRLAVFIEKALLWRQAIEGGTLPAGKEVESKANRSVFGPQ
ncbi:MAG: CesT family type III secretion system chaperone [Chlamydiales bacterium]|nr:CesT family type III secretion system chaperone [Chlamydiales bacterium]